MIRKILFLSVLCMLSCKKTETIPVKTEDYPKEIPATFYDYSEDGYIEQYINECDLSVYKGKVVKEIKTDNTDVIIYFTDGAYMYLDIYKYTPSLKFFKTK